MHQLTREQARRIAVRAQLLDANRPSDLVSMVDRLTMLQLDPTAAIAPSADLVAWSRLGASYRPEQLQQALEHDRTLFEFDAVIRPMRDLGLYLAEASQPLRYERTRDWLRDNDAFRRDVLARLERSGPITSRDIPDTSAVPWPSSGWTNNRNVTKMLEILVGRGEVAISGRIGRERIWDLPRRVYPHIEVPPFEDALRLRNERRLSSLGIARRKAVGMPVEPIDVGDAGEPAVVEGVKGEWRVDPGALQPDGFDGRTALLSPFDRLIHDRRRALELFDFDYTLEMYKPAEKRRWGYYALPILHGDRLIGKLDAIADRKASVLRVNKIHRDVTWTDEMTRDVHEEIGQLAVWLGMTDVAMPSDDNGKELRA
jgi:uncharacterized protein YcaQ